MTRTPLTLRTLPNYTRGEEIFHMVSHIVGASFGIMALGLMVIVSVLRHDIWAVVSSCIYGSALVILYTMSSLYHGLRPPMAKKVLQILDHCTIYYLIAGSYTPILLCAMRESHPGWAWAIFGCVWALAAVAITLNAIDLKTFSRFSMICYIAMGWCIILAAKPAIDVLSREGLILLLSGGIAYTLGAGLYAIGKKYRYMHGVFHLFVLLGSVLQFAAIYLDCILR